MEYYPKADVIALLHKVITSKEERLKSRAEEAKIQNETREANRKQAYLDIQRMQMEIGEMTVQGFVTWFGDSQSHSSPMRAAISRLTPSIVVAHTNDSSIDVIKQIIAMLESTSIKEFSSTDLREFGMKDILYQIYYT